MTKQKKKPKLVFTPGCFDNFDGTQEELDELLQHIQKMVDSGELFENAVPLDEVLDEFSEEELKQIYESLPDEDPKTLH